MRSLQDDVCGRFSTEAMMRVCALRLMEMGDFKEAGKLLLQIGRLERRQDRTTIDHRLD